VLEFGNLYILRTFTRCQRQAFKWTADREVLAERLAEQGKKIHKAEKDPRIAGYGLLPALLLTLEVLTLLAQTPFIAGQLLNTSAVALLHEIHRALVWGYAFLLVISPGIMTVAIGFAINYDEVMRQIEKREPWTARAREWLAGWLPVVAAGRTDLAARLIGHVGTGAANGRAVTEQGAGQNAGSRANRANDRADNRAVSGQLPDEPETEDVSQALAGHLAELRGRLTTLRQQGSRSNGTFRRADVEAALRVSNSHAKNILRYGLRSGVLTEVGRYMYEFAEK
jgi:hypothetical protein